MKKHAWGSGTQIHLIQLHMINKDTNKLELRLAPNPATVKWMVAYSLFMVSDRDQIATVWRSSNEYFIIL